MIPLDAAPSCPARLLALEAVGTLRKSGVPLDAAAEQASVAAAWAWIHREGTRPVDPARVGWEAAAGLVACGESESAAMLVDRLPLAPARRRALSALAGMGADPEWAWRVVRAGVVSRPGWPDPRHETWWRIDAARVGWGGGERLPLFERPVWRSLLERLAPSWTPVEGQGGLEIAGRSGSDIRSMAETILASLANRHGWTSVPVVRLRSPVGSPPQVRSRARAPRSWSAR